MPMLFQLNNEKDHRKNQQESTGEATIFTEVKPSSDIMHGACKRWDVRFQAVYIIYFLSQAQNPIQQKKKIRKT
jgi:hypothetical protein